MNLFRMRLLIIFSVIVITSAGCRTTGNDGMDKGLGSSGQTVNADDLLIVDCLLPGKIKKLGKMTYQSARQAVKTTAAVCEIRGGEYVAYDRADFSTALSVWLPQAKAGDQEAQTYVGEIYQKGLGIEPQYEIAAEWYKKAAQQGNTRAQMNLGFLYEKGLGVRQDSAQALNWYRKASGLGELLEIESDTLSTEERLELETLRKELEASRQERDGLKKELNKAKQELEGTQKRLKSRESTLQQRQRELQRARQELEMKRTAPAVDQAELRDAELELQKRETALENQRKEIAILVDQVREKEEQLGTYRNQLDLFERKFDELPDPVIEVRDPRVVATRGMKIASVTGGKTEHEVVGKIWAPAGIDLFEVNGRKEVTQPDGAFHVRIPAARKKRKTEVSLLAVDSRGKQVKTHFQLSVEEAKAAEASARHDFSSIQFGKYYALVIGNNAYKRLPKLQSAIYDAEAVSDLLQNKYGFETEVLLNASRYDILDALNRYLKKLTDKDNFLLYYAGHGELDTKNSRGYWLPVDADQDSNVNWIPSFAITDILNNMTAKQVIVVADTCYSGILTRSAIARLQPGMSDEVKYNYLKSMSQKRSRMVLSSGELKPVLDAGGGKHSVFARAFLDVLESNDEILEGWNLYNRVSKIVTYDSEKFGYQQVPQYSALIRGGHESGGFFFVPVSQR